MDWKEVESSNISAIAHTADNHLHVRFKNGSHYAYANVANEMFEEIMGGASIGRTFHQLVRSQPERYPFVCVT